MHRSIQPYPTQHSPQSHNTSSHFFAQDSPDPASVTSNLHHLTGDDASRAGHGSYHDPAPLGSAADSMQHPATHASSIGDHDVSAVSAEYLAHDILAAEQPVQQQSTLEQPNSRKKPKASKACDECRRKKVSDFKTLPAVH